MPSNGKVNPQRCMPRMMAEPEPAIQLGLELVARWRAARDTAATARELQQECDVDTYKTIVSKRDTRSFTEQAIPEDAAAAHPAGGADGRKFEELTAVPVHRHR